MKAVVHISKKTLKSGVEVEKTTYAKWNESLGRNTFSTSFEAKFNGKFGSGKTQSEAIKNLEYKI